MALLIKTKPHSSASFYWTLYLKWNLAILKRFAAQCCCGFSGWAVSFCLDGWLVLEVMFLKEAISLIKLTKLIVWVHTCVTVASYSFKKKLEQGQEGMNNIPWLLMTTIWQDKQQLPGPLCKRQYALAYDNAYEEVFAERNPDRD